jgi:hypothetical protein
LHTFSAALPEIAGMSRKIGKALHILARTDEFFFEALSPSDILNGQQHQLGFVAFAEELAPVKQHDSASKYREIMRHFKSRKLFCFGSTSSSSVRNAGMFHCPSPKS